MDADEGTIWIAGSLTVPFSWIRAPQTALLRSHTTLQEPVPFPLCFEIRGRRFDTPELPSRRIVVGSTVPSGRTRRARMFSSSVSASVSQTTQKCRPEASVGSPPTSGSVQSPSPVGLIARSFPTAKVCGLTVCPRMRRVPLDPTCATTSHRLLLSTLATAGATQFSLIVVSMTDVSRMVPVELKTWTKTSWSLALNSRS